MTSSQQSPRGRGPVLAALLAVLLTACGGGTPEPGAVTRGSGAPELQQCAAVQQAPVAAGAPVVVLVVDNTASTAPFGLAPAIAEELGAAQQQGAEVVLLAVDGAGAPPSPVVRAPLDPEPGKDSANARHARDIALACVATWAISPAAQPTSPGSDIAAALDAAARYQPVTVLVQSDGYANAGLVDLRVHGDSAPEAVAGAARAAGELPPYAGVSVVWAGVGETALGLSRAQRDGTQGLWDAWLGASGSTSVRFDPRPGDPRPGRGDTAALPADDVVASASSVLAVRGGEGACFRLPAALLFQPGSSVPSDEAAQAVAEVVARLAANPTWVADVHGHAADLETAQERARISTARATAIAGLIRTAANVDASRVSAQGFGSDRPLVPEWIGGVHDVGAAAENRRVEVLVHPAGSVAECAS